MVLFAHPAPFKEGALRDRHQVSGAGCGGRFGSGALFACDE
jgi:hypothetical protein